MRLTKMYLTLQYVLDLSRVECGNLIARRSIVDFEFELARYFKLIGRPIADFEVELACYFKLFRGIILRRTFPEDPDYLLQHPTRRFNNK